MADPIAELRDVVARADAPPAEMEPYLAKVRTRAYATTDEDVRELRDAGLSGDTIFEQTIAVAIAEGLRRLDVADRVIG